ncbi:hypothetical protein BRC93_08855 [Halobacteriales archaeon QS_5_70_15]|nr:MAG: hypothetical protein BRC93_08855 [Halobacteriales archaeon QS_5_70_15]
MDTTLDDIAFLADSANRVAVFEMLLEEPRTRNGIRDRVDASRVTVARILRELEERGWIEGSGRTHEVRPAGEWVCEEFTCLRGELEAEHRLREPLQWLPTEVLTFDVRCLRDAEVIPVEECNSTAIVRRIVEFHRSGDRIRGVARESAPEAIENQWELTVHGETRVDMVIAPDIVDAIRDHPPSARRFREMLDQENARYSVYEEIPVSIGVVDGAVGINFTDEHGTPKGRLKTESETVHAWAVDLSETCRERARPIDPDAIPV